MAIGRDNSAKSFRENLPDAEFGALAPFIAELEWLENMIAMHRLTDENCTRAKALELSRDRLRERIWEAVEMKEERSPEQIATLVGVHSDTVRYWCRNNYVAHRKTKSGRYMVEVESVLEYVRRH